VFSVGFTAAVVLLGATIVAAILALQPDSRFVASADALKRYGIGGREPDDVLKDAYQLDVALATSLDIGNDRRARLLLLSERLLAIALGFAAVDALILFFGS
jgi:hypothetical protein